MAYKLINWENIKTIVPVTATAYAAGNFLAYDGTGSVVDAVATDPIVGICLETLPVTNTDLTPIHYEAPLPTDTFVMAVTTGSAAASDVGSKFDLDTPSSLDVTAPGTQFTIVRVISATLVIVKVSLVA